MNAQPESVTAGISRLSLLRISVTPCPQCNRPMPPDMPVFFIACDEVLRAFKPVCERCFEGHARFFRTSYAGDVDRVKHALLNEWKRRAFVETPCVGCGRPVWKLPRKGNPRVFCSDSCAAGFYRRMALPRRPASACSVCGGAILGNPRGDIRYCSPACRQKAYRQRKQGAVR